MKKYNIYELNVVKDEIYYFICEKMYDDNTYREIFTKKVIKVKNMENVQPLTKWYSVLSIMNYKTGEYLKLTKRALLIKFAEINAFYISERKKYVDFREKQEEYLEKFKELSENNPEKAKEIAIKSLQKSGILDENGELAESYKESVEHIRTLKNI